MIRETNKVGELSRTIEIASESLTAPQAFDLIVGHFGVAVRGLTQANAKVAALGDELAEARRGNDALIKDADRARWERDVSAKTFRESIASLEQALERRRRGDDPISRLYEAALGVGKVLDAMLDPFAVAPRTPKARSVARTKLIDARNRLALAADEAATHVEVPF